MKTRDLCLVLTGCIMPSSNIYFLSLKDKNIRRRQYLEAIYFYIQKTKIQNIVFCDNSGAKEVKYLKDLAKKKKKNFEWLSFHGDYKKAVERGKGYGEGEILSYVIENSTLIKKCNCIAKITGRLKVCNIDVIIRFLSLSNDYFNTYIDQNNYLYVDTRFYVVNIKHYKELFEKSYELVNDREGFCLEHSIAQIINVNKVPYRTFPIALDIKGISGSTGMTYFTPRTELLRKSVILSIRYLLKREEKNKSINKLLEEFVWDKSIWGENFRELENRMIAIYGAGVLGKRFYKLCKGHCKVVAWVDQGYTKICKIERKKIVSPVTLKKTFFEYIVVAVSNEDTFKQIKKTIKTMGISENQIIWYREPPSLIFNPTAL